METLPKIANEKLTQNSAYREAVLSLISSGEAIAFIGAGLSSPLKYPSWPALLAKLHAQAQQIGAFDPPDHIKQDVLQYAEAIKEHFKKSEGGIDQYRSILGREFGPRQDGENCTCTHRLLVKLPFRAFVTTNYDECIEDALRGYAVDMLGRSRPDPGVIIKANKADSHRVSLFLRSISEKAGKNQCFVAHLHGRHDDTQNVILTATDYSQAYDTVSQSDKGPVNNRSVPLHRQFAWSLFATRRMVFIGCSMDDPYIKALLNTVACDLWEWNQPTHFVVLPLDSKSLFSIDSQAADFLRHGLQAVYFDNLNETFIALDQLLQEALEKWPADKIAATKPTEQTSTRLHQQVSTTQPPELHSKGQLRPEATVNLAWLEEVNETTAKSLKKNED